jgi:predicted ATPase
VESRSWPVSIPAVAQLLAEGIDLSPGVTLLVGENGSGKSTLVEAIAMAFGLAAEGGTRNVQEGTRSTESPLHRWIRLSVPLVRPDGVSSYALKPCTATSPGLSHLAQTGSTR